MTLPGWYLTRPTNGLLMLPPTAWVSRHEKVMLNIQRYGNTTAATIPLCLWDWRHELNKGDNIVLAAFGGGFTWGATLVKWAY